MKLKKPVLIVFLFLVISVPIIFSSFCTPYRRIERYVNSLGGKLEHTCNYYLEKGHVNSSSDATINVTGIYGDTNTIVQFDYSGFGIEPATKYYGFYYSPSNVPVPYCNDDYPLTKTADEEWTWNGDGDNGGIIRKIRDHVYYYEAWF